MPINDCLTIWLFETMNRSRGGSLKKNDNDNATRYMRRHSRWYEVILLSSGFQVIAGLVIVGLLPAIGVWGANFWRHMDSVRWNTLWAVGLSFIVTALVLRHSARLSGGLVLAHIGPVVTVVFLLMFVVLLFSRSSYSRPVLLLAYILSVVWCYIGYFIGGRYRRLKFAILPMEKSNPLPPTTDFDIRYLSVPDFQEVRYDAIIADLSEHGMAPEWDRFVAQCILAQIPVLDVRRVIENMTGRVYIDRLSENEAGSLLPSPLYTIFKRIIDIVGVISILPIVLPLMAVTAVAIRLDSFGPVLFVQRRVGLGNQDFSIYKFRSMYIDAESGGARLARTGDDRITRVGRFIRKTRLDELPQLWNVLKGDMSLIGPRPEQRVFANRFDAEIPFYIYRHVVRPGITGWAQVMQGYAADVDETRVKIQHDFYYIKHFSLWLDLLIVLKTVRIVLTGWGAR